MPPQVTVIVPVWNSARWLPDCLDYLAVQTFPDFEVVVVDSGSTDGATTDLDDRWPAVDLLWLPKNRGFAVAVNAGIRHSESAFVALLNVDTRVGPEWLERLVRTLDREPTEVGAVAPKMLQMADPGLIDNAGDAFSWYGSATKVGHGDPAGRHSAPGDVASISAGAALYRRSFLEEAGLFDEVFESYLEDVDLGLRGRLLGYRYLYEPAATVLHAGHGASLPRGRYVTLVTRNRLLVLLKNLPGRQLLRHARQVLYGQFYYLVVYRHPLHSCAGYFGFLRRLGHVLRCRRDLRSVAALPEEAWEELLSADLGEKSLSELVRGRWRPEA